MADIGFGPLWRIDGPLPIPPEYGLLQAATVPAAGVQLVTDLDDKQVERWMNGVQVYPYPPDVGDVYRACDAGSTPDEKGFGDELRLPEFEPMTLYVAETCTSYKVWDQAAFKARATATLEAVESFLMAREFMAGTKLGGQPFLADGSAGATCVFPNGDGPCSPIYGLTLLEEQIAESGRQGVIHCSPMLATSLMGYGFALKDKTGVIRTINGIVVVSDFGYAQASKQAPIGHAGTTGTEEWAYATGPVDIRRTEIFTMPENVTQALDRGTPHAATNGIPNSITYRVERYALVDWDTEVHAAVLVDRCQTACIT